MAPWRDPHLRFVDPEIRDTLRVHDQVQAAGLQLDLTTFPGTRSSARAICTSSPWRIASRARR